jgi:hypothetical protein
MATEKTALQHVCDWGNHLWLAIFHLRSSSLCYLYFPGTVSISAKTSMRKKMVDVQYICAFFYHLSFIVDSEPCPILC